MLFFILKLRCKILLRFLQNRTIGQYLFYGFILLMYLNVVTSLDSYDNVLAEINYFQLDSQTFFLFGLVASIVFHIIMNIGEVLGNENNSFMQRTARWPVSRNTLFSYLVVSEVFSLNTILFTPFYFYGLTKVYDSLGQLIFIHICILVVTGNISLLFRYVRHKLTRANILHRIGYFAGFMLILFLVIFSLRSGDIRLPDFTILRTSLSFIMPGSLIVTSLILQMLSGDILNILFIRKIHIQWTKFVNKFLRTLISAYPGKSLLYKEGVYYFRSPRNRLFWVFYLFFFLLVYVEHIPLLETPFIGYVLVPFYTSLFINGYADNYFSFDKLSLKKYFLSPLKPEKLIITKNIYLLYLSILFFIPLLIYLLIQRDTALNITEILLISSNFFLSVVVIILFGNYISIFFSKHIDFKDLTGSNMPFTAFPFTIIKALLALLLLIYVVFIYQQDTVLYFIQLSLVIFALIIGLKIVIKHTSSLLERRKMKMMSKVSY